MKQRNLPIHPPIIERKCRFGTCDEPLAYVINGVDLCFSHGRAQMEALRAQMEALTLKQLAETGTSFVQLELVK